MTPECALIISRPIGEYTVEKRRVFTEDHQLANADGTVGSGDERFAAIRAARDTGKGREVLSGTDGKV